MRSTLSIMLIFSRAYPLETTSSLCAFSRHLKEMSKIASNFEGALLSRVLRDDVQRHVLATNTRNVCLMTS